MNAPKRQVISQCSSLCRRRPLSAAAMSYLRPHTYSTYGMGKLPSATLRQRYCYPISQFHTSSFALSDNLLGHNPMARTVPTTSQQAAGAAPTNNAPNMWGTDSNTAGGGVWAQTSGKKDKLNELLTELNAEGVDTGELFICTF